MGGLGKPPGQPCIVCAYLTQAGRLSPSIAFHRLSSTLCSFKARL